MPEIKKGTTDVTRYIMIVDSGDGSPETGVTITGLDLQYTRNRTAPVAKVDATALAATDSAHSANKMIEIDSTSSPGLYRVDWPDAAFATGVDKVQLVVTGTGFAPAIEEITLVDNVVGDALDSNNRMDVGSWLGTAVTLSSGAPDVNIQSSDNVALTAQQKLDVNVEADLALTDINLDHLMKTATASSTDLTTEVADNTVLSYILTNDGNTSDYDDGSMSLEASAKDRVVFRGTSTASSTTTKVFVQAGDPPAGGADDDYNDTIIAVWDGTDKATARVNIRVVDDYDDSDPSFTVSPALGFTPAATDIVEVYRADTGALTLLNALASGFAATSPNRLIDHLRSIMSKGAVTPASVGTYDPATDSLEYASERRALIEGSGFATSTDSLKEIRDAIDTLVAPAVVSASSLSGSGFLADVVSLVRKATDEPSQSPKYTDGDIVEYLQAGMDAVLTDIHVNTDHPIIVRYTIKLVDGTQFYILPPNVAELMRIAKINSTTGLPEYEAWPGSHLSPDGSGWKLEGNVLRLLRDWNSTDSLELMYIPNAEPAMHKATASAIDSTTVTFPTSVTDGTLGKRPNEYVGMLLRILSSDQNYVEERLITAYDVTNRVATIAKTWDTTPTGTVVYEVVPIFSRTIKHVVALRTAIDILSQEGNSQRMATLNQNYAIKLSAMRRQLSRMEGRFPHHFDGDTWDNTNRYGGYGL